MSRWPALPQEKEQGGQCQQSNHKGPPPWYWGTYCTPKTTRLNVTMQNLMKIKKRIIPSNTSPVPIYQQSEPILPASGRNILKPQPTTVNSTVITPMQSSPTKPQATEEKGETIIFRKNLTEAFKMWGPPTRPKSHTTTDSPSATLKIGLGGGKKKEL